MMRFFKRGAIWFLAMVLVLITGEFLARNVNSYSFDYDSERGEVNAPGKRIRYRLEGNGSSHWWAHGVRRAVPPRETGITNILALGDSFTEGLQVNDDDVYTARLENWLNSGRPEGPWQVMNAGAAGASMADYLTFSDTLIQKWAPFWTIIQVQESDFKEDSWSSKKSKGMAYFRFQPDTGLSAVPADTSPKKIRSQIHHWVRQLRYHSSLAQFLAARYEECRGWIRDEKPLFVGESHSKTAAKKEATPPDYHVEEQVRLLKKKFAGRVTLLFLSPFDPVRRDWVTPFETELTSACHKEGVDLVVLSRHFSLEKVSAQVSPYGFSNRGFNLGHMNPLGHQLAAEALKQAAPFATR